MKSVLQQNQKKEQLKHKIVERNQSCPIRTKSMKRALSSRSDRSSFLQFRNLQHLKKIFHWAFPRMTRNAFFAMVNFPMTNVEKFGSGVLCVNARRMNNMKGLKLKFVCEFCKGGV